MERISEEDFDEKWYPLPARDLSMLWQYKELVEGNHPVQNVWSVMEGDTGGLYAVPGYHFVNVVGYCVTLVPWTEEQQRAGLEAVYSPPGDDDPDAVYDEWAYDPPEPEDD